MGWFRADILGVRLAYTDRRGGVSRPPYDSLDLSSAETDDAAVAENRARAARFAGVAPPPSWVPLHQVHGARVTVVGAELVSGDPLDEVEADAVVIATPGPVGVILTADCAPLALMTAGGAAAVHGGWRGLLAGVVGEAVHALEAACGPVRAAVLGPSIRACCYEFGADDLGVVADRFGPAVRGATRAGVPALDLPAAVGAAVREAGVVVPVFDLGVCTACSPDYYSYRRDGRTGRQALLVAVLSANST